MDRPSSGLPPVCRGYGHLGEVYQPGQALRDFVSLPIHQQDASWPAAPAPSAVIELLGPIHRGASPSVALSLMLILLMHHVPL